MVTIGRQVDDAGAVGNVQAAAPAVFSPVFLFGSAEFAGREFSRFAAFSGAGGGAIAASATPAPAAISVATIHSIRVVMKDFFFLGAVTGAGASAIARVSAQ